MEHEKFIYKNSLEAFSYLFVFLISVYIPMLISLVTEEAVFLLVIFFINSAGLLREYTLLISYKKVQKRFWIERISGIGISAIIVFYSIGALLCRLKGIADEVFNNLNIVCSILFLCPGVISAIEGIIYIVRDYQENVIENPIMLAQETATEV